MAPSSGRTPVLIAGGGLVGLSAALFLQYHGVEAVLVERRDRPSVLPRSRGVHTRTVELFRQVGIEDRVQEAARSALKMGAFGGARQGSTLLDATALDIRRGRPDAGRTGPSAQQRMTGSADASPSHFCFCPQVLLEPVLADVLTERGGDLRLGTELTGFTQDGDGVTATIRQPSAGRSATVRAGYLIAADGAASPVRQALGVSAWTLPPTHHYVNLFVGADLADLVAGRTFSQCEIANDTVRCLILSKNNTDEWSFHVEYDPARESIDDYPEQRCVDLVRAAIGADVNVKLLARSVWDTGVRVADDYRRGRVFLAGDAAHQHAPWGGFGANTGIADVHNLAWKLAAVLAGHAAPALLDTYQPERRPRAVLAASQALLRTDFLARYGVRTPGNEADVDRQLDSGAIMMRYRYRSPAVAGDTAGGDWVAALHGQAGTRLPHAWLDIDGRQVSALDLCGPGFAVLASSDAGRWREAADVAHAETGLDVAVHHIDPSAGQAEAGVSWPEQTGLPADGALLVRPDGHVAARSDGGLSPATLPGVLRAITAVTPAPGTPGQES
jgi:putative polyketide hydroxylase